jgi:hypothetical protein
MESALTMTPPVSSAFFSASADLPLAVGPAINTARRIFSTPAAFPFVSRDCASNAHEHDRHPDCQSAQGALGDETVNAVAALLPDAKLDWLDPGRAADIVSPKAADGRGTKDACRRSFRPFRRGAHRLRRPGHRPRGRRKKILIADMDSTMIRQECVDELADEAGVGEYVASITARAMNGEIGFEGALRERVGLLKGLPVETIEQVIATRIELMPGGPELVAHHEGAWRVVRARLRRLRRFHRPHRRDDRLSGKPRQPPRPGRRQAHRRGRRADPRPPGQGRRIAAKSPNASA